MIERRTSKFGVQIANEPAKVPAVLRLVLERGDHRLSEHLVVVVVLGLQLERQQRQMGVDWDIVESDLMGRSLVRPERERVQHGTAHTG